MKIAFIGGMHSGKTTSLNHVKEIFEEKDHLVITTKFATPLYKSQELFNPEKNFKNRGFLQELGDLAKKHFGENILTELFVDYIHKTEKNNSNKIVSFLCDDVRVPSEFERVRELGFITIGIKTDDKVRKQRNPKLFTGLNHRTEISINYLIEKCDIIIENNGTLEEFNNKLNKNIFSLQAS